LNIIGKIGTCINCGAEFSRKKRSKEYCSESCKSEFLRKQKTQTIVCPVCGKSFTTTRQDQIYCREKCRLNRASEKPQHSTKTVLTARCVICGKRLERINQKVCSSPECIKARRKQTRRYQYKGYQPKKKPPGFKLTPDMKARLKEIKEINKFRESMDLRTISAGIIPCRSCEQDFFSDDITRVKMCDSCKEANEFESEYVAPGGAKRNNKWLL
jgi:hypothetical protein